MPDVRAAVRLEVVKNHPESKEVRAVQQLALSAGASSVLLSEDGRTAFAGDWSGEIHMWEVSSGRHLHVFRGVQNPRPGTVITHHATSLAVTSDGAYLVAGFHSNHAAEADGNLRVWDLAKREYLGARTSGDLKVASVSLVANSTKVFYTQGNAVLYDFAKDALLAHVSGDGNEFWAGAVSADGSGALAGDWAGRIFHYDLQTGKLVRALDGHAGGVNSLYLATNSDWALSAGDDGYIGLWDLQHGECLRTMEGHEGAVLSLSVAEKTGRFLSGGADGTMRLWSIDRGECVHVFPKFEEPVHSVALSGDGRFAMGSAAPDDKLVVWEVGL